MFIPASANSCTTGAFGLVSLDPAIKYKAFFFFKEILGIGNSTRWLVGLENAKIVPWYILFQAYSDQVKANAKAKKIKEQVEEIKEKISNISMNGPWPWTGGARVSSGFCQNSTESSADPAAKHKESIVNALSTLDVCVYFNVNLTIKV